MLVQQRLGEGDGFAVVDLRRSYPRGEWSPAEPASKHGVVFVRSGCFRRVAGGVESVLDPTSVYFEAPGREARFLHLSEAGRCTAIEVSPALLERFGRPLPETPVSSPPFLDLEHRRLLALAHRAPASLDVDHVAGLLHSIVTHAETVPRAPDHDRRRTVDAVRELLAIDPSLSLLALARRVSVSPYHLSRVFAADTGQTISNYRNCIRARATLERIAGGERSLARIAADLGFADHAHLTRVVRREAGAPPSTLRELLRFGA